MKQFCNQKEVGAVASQCTVPEEAPHGQQLQGCILGRDAQANNGGGAQTTSEQPHQCYASKRDARWHQHLSKRSMRAQQSRDSSSPGSCLLFPFSRCLCPSSAPFKDDLFRSIYAFVYKYVMAGGAPVRTAACLPCCRPLSPPPLQFLHTHVPAK